MPTKRISLTAGWRFRLDPSAANDPQTAISATSGWQSAIIPHTWQTLGCSPDYVGVAWYAIDFDSPPEWQAHLVRIEFEAVFHTAHVYLNGTLVGEHVGKGYTAFQCDLSAALHPGQKNTLVVRVDNAPKDTILPRMESFDWANDGGIVRPVSLLLTPRVFIDRIEIDAVPNLEKKTASVAIRAIVRNTLPAAQPVSLSATVQLKTASSAQFETEPAQATIAAGATAVVALPTIHLDSPSLWHFDAPHLYSAIADLHAGTVSHRLSDTFGIRSFETRGAQFFLNGEPVRLMGVERMAGSHPEFGMAEPTAWIQSNHRDMKELNCVFTRVHWAQDKRVLDFCDENGILMQEEVPAWGEATFSDTTPELQHQLEQNGLEQLREMIARDRNHPSIVSWGLCNEVNGKNPRSRAFARVVSAEARKLDPSRLQTYASNTLGEHPEQDMAGEFDFISTNEYYGSWAPGGPTEVRESLERICKAFPNKPIVISEYGWCECQPSMPPGDQHRIEIVTGHTEVFREFPQVAGAIYFDYNDYRTLVGDKGAGAFKQRVHGVVDLYANRKPSFQVLRTQASPIESIELKFAGTAGYQLHFTSRKTLPAYTLRDYRVRWVAYGYDELPMDGRFDDLHPIAPGESIELTARFGAAEMKRIVVDILRPNGFSIASAECTELPRRPGPDAL
jgi:beta-galactosidase